MADDPGPSTSSSATALGAAVLPALAGAVAVGFGATGAGLLLPGADLSDAGTIGTRIGGVALAVAGLVALVTRWGRSARVPVRDVAAVVTAGAVVVAGITALTFAFSSANLDLPEGGRSAIETTTRTESDVDETPPPVPQLDEDVGTKLPVEILAGLVYALLLVGMLCLVGYALARVLGLARLLRWRRSVTTVAARPAEPLDLETAEAGLEASLRAVGDDDAEPRDAIAMAYSVLLAALAEAGAGRRRHEAPHEHLHRVLTPLGVRPEPLHRLAELFVLARFSQHSVTPAHRDEASTVLRAALDDLQAAARPAQAARPEEAR